MQIFFLIIVNVRLHFLKGSFKELGLFLYCIYILYSMDYCLQITTFNSIQFKRARFLNGPDFLTSQSPNISPLIRLIWVVIKEYGLLLYWLPELPELPAPFE